MCEEYEREMWEIIRKTKPHWKFSLRCIRTCSILLHFHHPVTPTNWSNASVNWEPIPFDFMDQGVSTQPAPAC